MENQFWEEPYSAFSFAASKSDDLVLLFSRNKLPKSSQGHIEAAYVQLIHKAYTKDGIFLYTTSEKPEGFLLHKSTRLIDCPLSYPWMIPHRVLSFPFNSNGKGIKLVC